jgi:virginiamycin A acetyltransferase
MGVLKNYIVAKIRSLILLELSKHKSDNNIAGAKIHSTAKIIGTVIHGNISISEGVTIDKCVIAGHDINIGRYTSINGPNTTIYAEVNSIQIGNFCSIARNVDIQEWNHPVNKLSTSMIGANCLGIPIRQEMESRGPIIIGHDVWIGTQCVVLSGVKIGNGAIIGANSVVSSDIPAFAIAVGNPAKVIKYRFDEKRQSEILKMEWWNWELKKIVENRDLFGY